MAGLMQVGFIGLGQMGRPMAERLLCPELSLHVFDPDVAAMERLTILGAAGRPDPASIANAAVLVLSCLPSPMVSEAVALGPNGIVRGQAVRTYVEMSTIGRRTVGRIADGLAERGIGLLDAPISGGPPGARAGTLAIMASGSDDDLRRAEPALRRIGRSIHRVGQRPGLGQAMKLVNNLVVAANMASTFEALVLGSAAGLDPQAMTDVLNASTGRSMVSAEMVPNSILNGRFNFGATIAIMEKDVALGLAEAAEPDIPLHVLTESARLWRSALDDGRGAEDITALICRMEQSAGIMVRSTDPSCGSDR